MQGRSQGGCHRCMCPPPPLKKNKRKNLYLVKKYNMNKQNFDLSFLGKFIYLMFKTLELPGGCAPLAPVPGLCPGPTWGP